MTSAQIAEVTKINRNTINSVLQLLRARILSFAEKKLYFEVGGIEIDESFFGIKRVSGKRGRIARDKVKVFFV